MQPSDKTFPDYCNSRCRRWSSPRSMTHNTQGIARLCSDGGGAHTSDYSSATKVSTSLLLLTFSNSCSYLWPLTSYSYCCRVHQVEVTVPSRAVGAIIGRGGDTVSHTSAVLLLSPLKGDLPPWGAFWSRCPPNTLPISFRSPSKAFHPSIHQELKT